MSTTHGRTAYTLADMEEIANLKLPDDVWEYLETGAHDNWTLLQPRMLRKVSVIDMTTTIFDKRYNILIALVPSAYQRLASSGGELDSSAASFDMGTNFTLSSNATTFLEDVMHSLPPRDDNHPRPWFQLYFLGPRGTAAAFVQRAKRGGFEALVLTIDTLVLDNRLHQRQHPLELPKHLILYNTSNRKAGAVHKFIVAHTI
ncbi:hypothetical protein COCC4DRAFT_59562 [Bipolaris maydis ATCC 48331]|uniref:FMN hydroxy acid dehydrogenase domain-containing protein n=3 Tax=Cochliobolus heterostrophus TaxID=5016 RepID=M2TME1_COCH5|nr:uncharacterized protein COCC4DRAFT_59562 [Bipolaris maydis ATCC 48331]EMD87699.1 hypothetical protein COCHEDRAFT_1112912 [Bipolaris maydis C5]ENI06899.1 hypothetical protein COCC4DRAFT_59562 [Bipolaris maydis ATCC 48331]